MYRRSTPLIAAALVTLVATTSLAQVTIQSDSTNLLSGRMAGEWVADSALTARLGWTMPAPAVAVTTGRTGDVTVGTVPNSFLNITFKPDTLVATRIPSRWMTDLQGQRIYLSGTVTLLNANYPYLLVGRTGDQRVIYFLDQNNAQANTTRQLVMTFVPGKDARQDILFVRAENDQNTVAYRRADPN